MRCVGFPIRLTIVKYYSHIIAALGGLLTGCLSCAFAQDVQGETVPKAMPIEVVAPQFNEQGVATSRSGQFKISGSDGVMRAAAANLAEEVKWEILKMLEEKDEWKVPVMVELSGKFGEPAKLRSTVLKRSFNELGYQVTIMVNLNRGLQQEAYQRAVISSLILARAFKEAKKGDEEARFSVPPWLVEGLVESIAWRTGKADRRPYETLFQHGGLFEVDKLFSMDDAGYLEMDAASRAAFRVSSGALVMALYQQPEGKNGMRALLKEIAVYDGETPSLLRQHFPELNLSRSSLEKWWALQLAEKGAAPLTEVLGVPETDEALEQALILRYRDQDGLLREIPFSKWEEIPALEQAERTEAIRIVGEDLVRLSYRCFPSYRPLLNEYQMLLSQWAAGKHENLGKGLTELAQTREVMTSKSKRARDYLDWFEITRARETSGAFDDYLSLKSRLKTQNHTRKDGVSEYLDRLDPLFVVPEKRRMNLSPLSDLPQD
jgi:hypothetical protein